MGKGGGMRLRRLRLVHDGGGGEGTAQVRRRVPLPARLPVGAVPAEEVLADVGVVLRPDGPVGVEPGAVLVRVLALAQLAAVAELDARTGLDGVLAAEEVGVAQETAGGAATGGHGEAGGDVVEVGIVECRRRYFV